MSEISSNMGEILNSSKQINSDCSQTDGFIKEISQIVESSDEITKNNEAIFEKIENASSNLKQSVI